MSNRLDDICASIYDNDDGLAATKAIADQNKTDISTLNGKVTAIEADYLVEADKTALQEQITANASAIELLTNGVSADEVDGVNDLINYVKEHGPEVTGMKADIAANAKAITDEASRADAAEKALAGRLDTLEAIDHDAYVAADTALKSELNAEIAKKADASTVVDMDAAYKAADAELTAAIETAKTEASNKDAVVLSESQKYADQVKADAEGKINALASNVYTKAEVEDLFAWGSF